jgi:hypothetical protein
MPDAQIKVGMSDIRGAATTAKISLFLFSADCASGTLRQFPEGSVGFTIKVDISALKYLRLTGQSQRCLLGCA